MPVIRLQYEVWRKRTYGTKTAVIREVLRPQNHVIRLGYAEGRIAVALERELPHSEPIWTFELRFEDCSPSCGCGRYGSRVRRRYGCGQVAQ
jgi:hypothetical protein